MNEGFWQNKIKAFLHDPPDKALILGYKSHEKRRDAIIQMLGLTYDNSLNSADHITSTMQRIDYPEELRKYHIYFGDPVKPVFRHTLSGELEYLHNINNFIATYGYEKARDNYLLSKEIIKNFSKKDTRVTWKKMYLSLWRFLPDKYPLGYFLPADTRIPDHSIWDHLDVNAAISSCLDGLSLFAVKMPAVQEFISQSRKLSDLWASSYIFSQLIFEGIKVIVNVCGPDAIIYPHLRDNPLFDVSILQKKLNNLEDQLRIANFPNTFLSFVPLKRAGEIAKKCEDKIKNKWQEIAGHVRNILKERSNIEVDNNLWEKQTNDAIYITTAWQEVFSFDRYNGKKEDLPWNLIDMQEKWLNFVEEVDRRSNYGHFYYLAYELVGTILTQKSRLWHAWEEKPITGKKCLMCGRRNAVIEKDLNGEYSYWVENNWRNAKVEEKLRYILKERERLCATCLIKRIYPLVFEEKFGIRSTEFDSVVDVAARNFIERIKPDEDLKRLTKIDVELIYEHEWGKSEDKIPKDKKRSINELKNRTTKDWKELKEKVTTFYNGKMPNKYYGILMMDGDRIREVLSGEKLPKFEEFLHPAFKNEIRSK